MSATQQGSSYWRYVKLAAARVQARGLIAALFALLAFAATVWAVVVERDKPGPWASLFTLLSAIFAALTVIRVSMKASFDENYSLPFALAHGYVYNFAKHAIADLVARAPGGRLVVFRPRGLDELDDGAVEDYKRRIESLGFESTVRSLPSEGKRLREVIEVASKAGGAASAPRYVDFPSTLLTLRSLVDYRNAERKRKSELPLTEREQRLITEDLIDRFFEELVKLLADDISQGRVAFTDSKMVHL